MRFSNSFHVLPLAIIATGFVVTTNTYAADYEGTGVANAKVNNGPPLTAPVNCGSNCQGTLDPNGISQVLDQSADVGGFFTLSIDAGAVGNYAQANPSTGVNATLTLNLDAHVTIAGQRLDSPDNVVLVSNEPIPSFPPQGEVAYTLQNTVTFTGPNDTVILYSGSHITLSPAD